VLSSTSAQRRELARLLRLDPHARLTCEQRSLAFAMARVDDAFVRRRDTMPNAINAFSPITSEVLTIVDQYQLNPDRFTTVVRVFPVREHIPVVGVNLSEAELDWLIDERGLVATGYYLDTWNRVGTAWQLNRSDTVLTTMPGGQ
jgi:hypothetical protein